MNADFQADSPGVYTQAIVAGDFSGVPGWNNGLDAGRATIVDENGNRFLRVTYTAGVFGPNDGGVQFLVPLAATFEELYSPIAFGSPRVSISSKVASCQDSWVVHIQRLRIG